MYCPVNRAATCLRALAGVRGPLWGLAKVCCHWVRACTRLVNVLVEAPDWAHPQLGADEEDHRPLHAPNGVLTALHGELGQWPWAQGGVGCRGNRAEVGVLAGYEGGDIVHRALVDQRLIGLGVVAFVVDQGEVL